MGNTRTVRILFSLLAVSLGIIIVLLFKTSGLRSQLQQEENERKSITEQMDFRTKLMKIDSLLVHGEYEEAVKAYNFQRNELKDADGGLIDLRIALAEKIGDLQEEQKTDSFQNDSVEAVDTTEILQVATAKEIQQYDSISFALEKAKVQLSRMKRLVHQKSFGEYLTFTSSKGSKVHYVGQVKNGKAQGHGVAILSTGSRYEGEWKDNLRDGEGSFYWPDGQYYEGEYKNDKREGLGTYHWSNGEKFVGLWKNDQRTGEGTFYGKDGKVVASGVWENDQLIAANKP